MTWWTIIGLILIAAGVTEFVLFRLVLRDKPAIKSKMTFLMANAGFNILAGLVLAFIGRRS
jgi:hypothetical protein